MEFIDGQDLQSYLMSHGGSLTEEVARFVFQQLCITVREIQWVGDGGVMARRVCTGPTRLGMWPRSEPMDGACAADACSPDGIQLCILCSS